MDTVTVPYVSCIKLRGSPILPPVMTAVRRKEMQQYKELAICIEKRLLYSKRVSMDSGLGTATNCDVATGREATISPQNNLSAVVSNTLNLTDCSSSSEFECDEVLVKHVKLSESNMPSSNVDSLHHSDTPSSNVESQYQSYTPTSNQLVVDSYNDDSVKKPDSDAQQASETTITPEVHDVERKSDQLDETFSSVAMSASTDLNRYGDMSLTSSTTSLLGGEQQESVLAVLEPLPLCVSGLRLQHKSLMGDGAEETAAEARAESARPRLVRSNSYTLEAPSPVLLAHVQQARRNCLSRDSLLPRRKTWTVPLDEGADRKFAFALPLPVEDVCTGKKLDVYKQLSTSLPGSSSSSPVKLEPAYASTDCVLRKILPFTQLKNSVENKLSTASALDCKSNGSSQSFDSSNHVSHLGVVCATQRNKDIRQLFAELQSNYEKEKAELLAKQKQEQEEMEMMFRDQCEQLVAAITNQCPQPAAAKNDLPTSSSSASPPSKLPVAKARNLRKASTSTNHVYKYSDAEHKAASVIEAAARGYLVRRLMRTEKVRALKATIQDTVKCALRLEQDCRDEVTPADVELHRGLITQLNSAILELHHLFFSITVKEKMDVIATDRLRVAKQQSRALPQLTISAATRKYLQRKSINGLMTKSCEDSRRPKSCPSGAALCRSPSGSSRGNSIVSVPGARSKGASWPFCDSARYFKKMDVSSFIK
ncbi:uncharacterized protein LOC134534589 isoform X3 [Bacillus rossius redtenbacheri]